MNEQVSAGRSARRPLFTTLRVLMRLDQRRLAYALTLALGVVLDLTGALHVYGLSALMSQKLATGAALLLSLIAAGWVLLATRSPALRASTTTFEAPLPTRLLLLLILLAWLATTRSLVQFLLPEAPASLWWLLGSGVVLLLAALWRPPAPGLLALGAAGYGSLARIVAMQVVPIAPERGDMLPLVQGALQRFTAGLSPYTIYTMPWELPLTYLPLNWLAYLLPFGLGLDIRLTNLAAELAIGGLIVWLAAVAASQSSGSASYLRLAWQEPALLCWAWVFLQPTALNWSLATAAPVQWLLVALILALLLRAWYRACALALGVGGATTLLAGPLAPFVMLVWLKVLGARTALRLSLIAAGCMLLLLAPFVIWSPGQFVYGVWSWFNNNQLYPQLRWEMDNTWARMIGFSGMFWRHELVGLLKPIQSFLLGSLLVVFWRLGAAPARLVPLIVATFLLFMVFNPVLWPYLYTPALVAALLSLPLMAAANEKVEDNC